MLDDDTATTAEPTQGRFARGSADDPTYDVDPGHGWVLFAGIMLAIVADIVVQFLVLPADSAWAIMVFFVDVIFVFGLLNYGGRDRHSLA